MEEAILFWQYYLIGQEFTIFTDHKPLEDFNRNKCIDTQLNYVLQFNFQIKYNPGCRNVEADCLSRNPVLDPKEGESDSVINIVNCLKVAEIIENQKLVRQNDKSEIVGKV